MAPPIQRRNDHTRALGRLPRFVSVLLAGAGRTDRSTRDLTSFAPHPVQLERGRLE